MKRLALLLSLSTAVVPVLARAQDAQEPLESQVERGPVTAGPPSAW